jgi:choline dehydrogenase-like flavoprotein
MTFIDARSLEQDTEIEGDLCIVGAGAAGIAMAREFIGSPLRVLLLESGDLTFRHRPQFLYLGESVGLAGSSMARSRMRMFGGSTNCWGGQCRPLDPIDFEQRDGVPYSGWPISRDDLIPYYRRAQEVCNLGPYDYSPSSWVSDDYGSHPLHDDDLETRIYQFGYPRKFDEAYRQELSSATNVTVYLNANVLEIETDAQAREVTSLRVGTFAGKGFRIASKVFVLASGGIENPRLLLASNRVAARGLGNEHDLVGRFFMDHPYFFMGFYEPAKPEYDRSIYVIEDYDLAGIEQKFHAGFTLSERVRRHEGLNGASIYLLRRPSYKSLPEYYSRGGKSFGHIVEVLRHDDLPNRRLGRHMWNVVTGVKDVGLTLSRQIAEKFAPRPKLGLRAVIEPTPNPDSRVTLCDRRDFFGMPRVRMDWRLNPEDRRGLKRLLEIMHREFQDQDLGRLTEFPWDESQEWHGTMWDGKHHMGTTRMDADPSKGVVDVDCLVHGHPNLYIAGSSVFPTAGYANPTLTIVALALRLADHLKGLSKPTPR